MRGLFYRNTYPKSGRCFSSPTYNVLYDVSFIIVWYFGRTIDSTDARINALDGPHWINMTK